MARNTASMKIMLVDDIQMERMQLAIRLKQLGHEVEMASSGREALDRYASFEPELVLLDLSMPEMDGFEVSTAIRAQYDEWIPIIFLSGHDEPEMIAKAIEAGGDDYLVKPVDKIVLNSKLVAMQRIALMRRELKQATAELELANAQLQEQAYIDGLTSVYNRRFMDDKLAELLSWHSRHQQSMTVILLDVDFFKPFNDNYGHIEGDKCLKAIARVLNEQFSRVGEYVGRYGGEEFAVLLSDCSMDSAIKHANRIQKAMQRLDYQHLYSEVAHYVTVSQGVCCFVPNGQESTNDIYSRADSCLYQAKNAGRNTFVVL